MLFNSVDFAIFLPIVFCIYWALQNQSLKIQNGFVLLASYIFYGWWDYRFLSLIIISSGVDYLVGIFLSRTQDDRRRKLFLGISIVTNLGILGFFKYFGFFVESFVDVIQVFGFKPHIHSLKLILPVGISFYTFQTLSYTIDIYRRKVKPTSDLIAFFAYVSFFPQLVAGPIERAFNLLPQFLKMRKFDIEKAKDGLRQIAWGMFKKVVIADNLARFVDNVYTNFDAYTGPEMLLGTLYFAIQIYCDFSGYSDIAIGTARLFGFNLMRNFAYPYFSRDIGEFWRRWHISLSTWFRDYVYIPLGGSRTETKARHLMNLIITFTLCGFWHGASWTFISWGFLNALYYLPLVIAGRHRRYNDVVAQGRYFPTFREMLQIASTFSLTLFAWIFFRANSMSHAFGFIQHLFSSNWLKTPSFLQGLPYVLIVLIVEWFQRDRQHALQVENIPVWGRWAAYYAVFITIFLFANTGHVPFIYFQF
jgi:D-alanyl-lipoteichoic acid acyltransferase DltB (MBOAT superfamily)